MFLITNFIFYFYFVIQKTIDGHIRTTEVLTVKFIIGLSRGGIHSQTLMRRRFYFSRTEKREIL